MNPRAADTRPPRTRCVIVGTATKSRTRAAVSRAIVATSAALLPLRAASAAARTTRPSPTEALPLSTCSIFVFCTGRAPTTAAW